MEVHHHSHHPKKWKEYISEFFMLFMAVFAGFMAESYLEYRAERHKEHDYLVSMLTDLKIDIDDISRKEINMKEVYNYGRKLSDIVYEDNWEEKSADSAYIWAENMVDTEVILQYANGTIDQLKNAGGFRLIKNKVINDKIKDYIKGQDRIKGQEEGFNSTFQDVLTERSNVMYARLFDYSGNVLNGKSIVTLKKDKINKIYVKTGSKFLSKNPADMFKLSNKTFIYTGQLFVYRAMAIDQKAKAIELIKIIQEELNH
jgi:hypothetical protein